MDCAQQHDTRVGHIGEMGCDWPGCTTTHCGIALVRRVDGWHFAPGPEYLRATTDNERISLPWDSYCPEHHPDRTQPDLFGGAA